MRTNTLLAFATLSTVASACGGLEHLDCSDGQAIGFDLRGVPMCQSLGTDGQPVPIPACTTDEALTVNDGHVRCTLRTNLTDLVTLRANVVALSEILANTSRALAEIGPPILKRSTYMGSSFMIGRARAVSFQTGALGITAVSEICEAAFGPSAHLCTPYELHRSASLGLLAGQTVPRSWVYFPAWNSITPLVPPDRYRGVGDTCNGYTIETNSQGYRGVTVEWGMLATGAPGFQYHGGSDASCSLNLPYACCR